MAGKLPRFVAECVVVFLNAYLYARYFKLVRLFVQRVGYWPNFANPGTHNEKVNWRKLFDRNPEFARYQDKLLARDIVESRCPEISLPNILWVGADPNAIPFDDIDRPVVIKTNHGCGYNYFVRDPHNVDRLDAVLFFNRCINERWGQDMYEWAYEAIEPKIYIEEMLVSDDGDLERRYKASVFSGIMRMSQIAVPDGEDERRSYFNEDGEIIDAKPVAHPKPSQIARLPIHDTIDHYATLLCRDFDALRADFFVHDGKAYFNEFTIYPGSGITRFSPREFDFERGKYWDITTSHYFEPGHSSLRRFYLEALRTLQPPKPELPVGSWQRG